jgi:hypothetical protein
MHLTYKQKTPNVEAKETYSKRDLFYQQMRPTADLKTPSIEKQKRPDKVAKET